MGEDGKTDREEQEGKNIIRKSGGRVTMVLQSVLTNLTLPSTSVNPLL